MNNNNEVYPKWVLIEKDGEFLVVLGMCKFHKELPERIGATKEDVRGGGWFVWKKDKGELLFNERSEDFGHAEVRRVHEAFFTDNFWERKGKKFPIATKVNTFKMECYETKNVLEINKE